MNELRALLQDEEKTTITRIVVSIVCLFLSFFQIGKEGLPFEWAWLAIVLCGLPIIKEATIALVTEFDIRADVLVAVALIASVVIGETFAAGEVAVIMTIGAFLEERTVNKARAGIERLIALAPKTARILTNGEEKIIAAKEVKVGDALRVLAGESIPVDGVIIEGVSAINQAVLTGESLPVDKSINDEVFSGTVNQFGTFTMKATKVGADTSIERMIRLVETADASKAPIVKLTDRWATWVVIIAFVSAIGTWFITGEVVRAVTILVVFCPCALVLATPTAIMAGIGNATKSGVLIKNGDALEHLAKIKRIAFDKTGTLTSGEPSVVAVEIFSEAYSAEDLLAYTAAAEQRSEHPLGKAILRHYQQSNKTVLPVVTEFSMLPGRGVRAQFDQVSLCAGNIRLFKEQEIIVPELIKSKAMTYENEGATVIFVSLNQAAIGLIALADTVRPTSNKMVENLKDMGVQSLLLTGDHASAAQNIAKIVGIGTVHSELLPEGKMNMIYHYQEERKEAICMIGDGVNDAAALKTATIGIALGGIGSDIAIDAADITIVNDDIDKVPYLLFLARKTMQTINRNVALSLALNFVAIILAMLGILNPVVGALVHNAGSIAVIISSALLLQLKDTKEYKSF
ncbi:MAG: copper/silver-translocating P-type ATPase [Firmicutes bacterium]|nr:copper/silver-translocating P-type ATPase [Bacillota bacterium]